MPGLLESIRFRSAVGGALTASLALTGVACSSGGGAGDLEAFCEQARSLDELADDDDFEAGMAAFDELVDEAPSDIKAEVEKFRTLLERMEGLEGADEDDPGAMAEAMGLIFDPELMEAGEKLEAYLEEECGIEPEEGFTPIDEADDTSEELDDPSGTTDSTADDDLGDDPLAGATIESLEAYVDDADPDGAGSAAMSSISLSGSGTTLSVVVGLAGSPEADDALELCTLTGAWAEGEGATTVDIEITIDGETAAVRGDGDDTCREV